MGAALHASNDLPSRPQKVDCMNRTFWRAATTACIALSICACAAPTRGKEDPDANRPPIFREPVDFIGVFFKPGRPTPDDGLSTAALASFSGEAALENDLELLKQAPSDIPLRTAGYTDTHECDGYECVRLSLRRAEFMRAWFVAHGIPETRLDPPKGYGAARPIGDNLSESGRMKNRRAHVDYDSETAD